MKRQQAQKESTTNSLPPEIVSLIGGYVKSECIKLSDFLNWCASTVSSWSEYVSMSDEVLIGFCREKKKRNIDLLKKTLRRGYRDNAVDFAHFRSIIKNCAIIKSRIDQIINTEMQVLTKDMSFVCDLHLMHGMSFDCDSEDEDECLTQDGIRILNNVALRTFIRLEWEFFMVDENGEGNVIKFPLSDDTTIVDGMELHIR